MPAMKDDIAGDATSQATLRAFDGYKSNFNKSEQQLRTVVLAQFRAHFPDQHVTMVKKHFDFEGFARAGKATMVHEPGNDELQMWSAVRAYKAPARRCEPEHGRLKDQMDFARYSLEYQGASYALYCTRWYEVRAYGDQLYWILLAPKEGASADGHHPAADALLLDVARWSADLHDEIYVFDNSDWTKSASLWESVNKSSWDDVIMDPKTKQNLIDDVQGFFESQHLYQKFRVPWKRGVILHGVPGNGKTCSIKALMNYLGNLAEPIPSLYVKSLDNKCNMPQWSVEAIFSKAREMSPCLLIFEDLDSLISEKVRSYFLNEVDGLESNDGILMIGSTNHLNKLDPAISKRPSRFDRKYHFRIPDLAQRVQYSEYWRQKLVGTDLDFPAEVCPLIAQLTESFSFAYMKELFVVSLLVVARGGKGDDDGSDWEDVSHTQTPPESEAKDSAAEQTDTASAETNCEHCKHTKSAEQKESGDESADRKKKKQKQKLVVPTIEIPESLKDNVLLKVVQQQVKMLLHEMDNTFEEEEPTGIMAADASTGCSDGMC